MLRADVLQIVKTGVRGRRVEEYLTKKRQEELGKTVGKMDRQDGTT